MNDLIDRQVAIDAIVEMGFQKTSTVKAILCRLETLPSAQRTGRWIWDDEGFHCSECWHHTYGNTGEVLSGIYKFCPSCGARMEDD